MDNFANIPNTGKTIFADRAAINECAVRTWLKPNADKRAKAKAAMQQMMAAKGKAKAAEALMSGEYHNLGELQMMQSGRL